MLNTPIVSRCVRGADEGEAELGLLVGLASPAFCDCVTGDVVPGGLKDFGPLGAGFWSRACEPRRPGRRTSKPQREQGLLLTSHSLPQRGHVMMSLFLCSNKPALSKCADSLAFVFHAHTSHVLYMAPPLVGFTPSCAS